MKQTITTADGQPISAQVYRAQEAHGVVLIVPAMSVRQSYYEDFARWIASQGFTAITFDYRGTGNSRHGSLKGFEADIMDWAQLDTVAVVEAAKELAAGRPMYWIGHSLGGQIVPFVENHQYFDKIITVATGSGYWRENTPAQRKKIWWFWHVVVPMSLPLFGYFPGKKLRKVGDLPLGVIQQWRRWCLNPEYSVGAEPNARARYAAVRTPIHSLSFTDDELMSEKNIASIHSFYSGAKQTQTRLAPSEVQSRDGTVGVGHFGCFKEKFSDSLWKQHLLPQLQNSKTEMASSPTPI